MSVTPWLTIRRGDAPLLVSLPHTGTELGAIEPRLTSRWLGQRDCDWWIDRLYDFAGSLGATVVHTAISRTVIDVNRDPSGASLYPGKATTELCPTTTFDGDLLYRVGEEPEAAEIDQRRTDFFEPYHDALKSEIARLRAAHPKIVLYDCHSIRSVLPLLFEGTLPVFNLGTNGGKSCNPALQERIAGLMARSGQTWVVNGRFTGGWITRHHEDPAGGVHALQMELSNRGYMREPEGPATPQTWPTPYDAAYAADMRATLTKIIETAIAWARA
ncbi:MAG: N-formylglutamate deformylase [Pseudaminobacter sp.]|nr:N-formylglutamate deformylase [Pseudaminobacter sp.]